MRNKYSQNICENKYGIQQTAHLRLYFCFSNGSVISEFVMQEIVDLVAKPAVVSRASWAREN